ncbi:MAG: antitoxin [Desulfovibrio sp.]|nr:antitoxin [Desulfovibrio sp.]
MDTASIFTDGRSQAVRLPKGYQFSGDKVYIKRVGRSVVLLPHNEPWATLLEALGQCSSDFMNDREQLPMQERETL